ncbi:MAG: EamA family transporter, partial [Clostridia bacterium]|nr:EamA family transporter [Clostridia bacterium]
TSFLIAILYQSVGCSILGFLMQNTAIATIGVNKSASFIGASTVASILAGVIFLKEKFTLLQVIGAIIIVGGIYIANAKNGKE